MERKMKKYSSYFGAVSLIVGGLLIMALAVFIKISGFRGSLVMGGIIMAGMVSRGVILFRRAGITGSTKNTRVAKGPVHVYEKTDSASPLLATLQQDDGVNILESLGVDMIQWNKISCGDRMVGFVCGEVPVYTTLRGQTKLDETEVYRSEDRSELPIATLPKGTELEIREDDWIRKDAMLRVWLPDGRRGYVGILTEMNWQ